MYRSFGRFLIAGLSSNRRTVGTVAFTGLCAGVVAKVVDTGDQTSTPDVTTLPEVKLARKIMSSADTSGLNLRLYQYQTCPFCCKVRAFLNFYGFSYEVVEVNPVTRKQIKEISSVSTYRKVPIVVAQGQANEILKDSSLVISILRTFVCDPSKDLKAISSWYPELTKLDHEGKQKTEAENKYFIMFQDTIKTDLGINIKREEREWRTWADEVLVHTLSPNVYKSFGESLDSFRWFSVAGEWETNFPAWERLMVIYVGAGAMWMIGKRLKKRHHLKVDVRESLYDAAKEWLRAIGSHRQFMGGDLPNLADLAVYGVLNSIEGCAAFKDLRGNTNIGPWYDATKKAVEGHMGAMELSDNLRSAER